jgi:hypothetical protein
VQRGYICSAIELHTHLDTVVPLHGARGRILKFTLCTATLPFLKQAVAIAIICHYLRIHLQNARSLVPTLTNTQTQLSPHMSICAPLSPVGLPLNPTPSVSIRKNENQTIRGVRQGGCTRGGREEVGVHKRWACTRGGQYAGSCAVQYAPLRAQGCLSPYSVASAPKRAQA